MLSSKSAAHSAGPLRPCGLLTWARGPALARAFPLALGLALDVALRALALALPLALRLALPLVFALASSWGALGASWGRLGVPGRSPEDRREAILGGIF